MNLQNGYRVIYEKIANGERTFYATKNVECNPTVDDELVKATIGEYRLVYEKDGQIYGSVSGVPADGDKCFKEFDTVFKVDTAEPQAANTNVEDETPAADEPEQIPDETYDVTDDEDQAE